jgi:hypothetical protein
MPTGYEAQNGFETAAASLDRDSDPDYHSIFREYSTHAKQVLSEAMKTHKLDAFVFPGVANAPFCKAQWPQVIVPMGFLGELDTPIIKDFNRKTKQPFPIEYVLSLTKAYRGLTGSQNVGNIPWHANGLDVRR